MVLEYNHRKMEQILELFCDAKIASLDIFEQEGVYLINYSLIHSFTSEKQKAMITLMDLSLPIRIKIQDTLTKFTEHMALDNVKDMQFHFSILNTKYVDLKMSLVLKDDNLVPRHESDLSTLYRLFNEYDNLVQDMGVFDLPIPGIFRREGSGKNRKYIQQTMGDVTKMLKSALEEE